MDVLSRVDRHEADFDMRLGDREVEHDLDRRICEQRLDRARLEAEFARARLGSVGIGVGEADDLEDRKTLRSLEVRGADVAAADDPDADALQSISPVVGFAAPRTAAGPVVLQGAP